MKFSFGLITTLISVALCGVVHAAPAPLCDRTNGLCGDIAARDVADSMMADDLVARAASKKAANAKIQRQAASKIEKKVKTFQKQANKGVASPGKVNAQANKIRKQEQSRALTQARKDRKAAKTQAWAGAANRATTSKNLQAVQKAQGQRQKKVQDKKTANAKIQQKATGSVEKKVKAFRNQAKKGVATKKQIDAQSDKIRKQEKSRVATQARADHKTAKAQQWAAKKKTPVEKATTKAAAAGRRQERQRTGAPSPANQAKLAKNIKMTKQEKQNVKDRFQSMRQKLSQTQGMPTRKNTVTVGGNSANGRAVRQSVFNNYLHEKTPIGRNPDNRQPKRFENRPYSATHGEANLRGKTPLPQGGKRFKEYPVINNSPNGWTGSGAVGALRTVTYKQGGQRRAAVIGHDRNRGGDENDHYVGVTTREIESSDIEDLE